MATIISSESIRRLWPVGFVMLSLQFAGLIRAFEPTPGFAWAQSLGGSSNDFSAGGNGIVTDALGNIYTVGWFSGTADFGGTRLTSTNYSDISLVKLSRDGKVMWTRQIGAKLGASGYGIAMDINQNVYITGTIGSNAYFGNLTVTNSSTTTAFVAKYDDGGDCIWATALSPAAHTTSLGNSIAIDDFGNAYLTGSFAGKIVIGGTNVFSSGGFDIFIAKLDSSGRLQWFQRAGGSGFDYGWGIAVDRAGNAFVTGQFAGTVRFGTLNVTSYNNSDAAFVAKLNPDGDFLWVRSPNSGYGRAVAVDFLGNCCVCGTFGESTNLLSNGLQDVYIAKFSPDGNPIWERNGGGAQYDVGYGVAVDSLGNICVTGNFSGTATFGSTNVTSRGNSDIFVAKYDLMGNFLWVQSAGGTNADSGWAAAVDPAGNVYIKGNYADACDFGASSLGTNGSYAFFAARLDTTGPPLSALRTQTSFQLFWSVLADNFSLESTDSLSGNSAWTSGGTNVVQTETTKTLTLPTSSDQKFFRLKR